MNIFKKSLFLFLLLGLSSCRQPKDKVPEDPKTELPIALGGDDDPPEGDDSGELQAVCQILENEGLLGRGNSESLEKTEVRIVVTEGEDFTREGHCPELQLTN